MTKSRIGFGLLTILCTSLILIGCSGSDKKTNPLSSFEPEIINTADAFQFQVTNAKNVNTTVTYPWANTGTQATIDHSTVTTAGSATVFLFDADTTGVYTAGLVASLNESSSAGTTGNWMVRVVFIGYSGTVNFSVEKL